jgi:hypothetical protein
MKPTRQTCFLSALMLCVLCTAAKAEDTDDNAFAAVVEQRVRDWQPTKDERLLDQIGWASNLVEAKRLAKEHGRPLFVFTYSGSTVRANAIALQRC